MSLTKGAIARRTPGGRGDGKKATKAEKEQRIQRAMVMIIQGCAKSEIKKAFRDTWGLGWYQIERYMSYARARLAEEDGLGPDFSIEDMRIQHYSMAMAIARADSGATDRDQLAALKLAGSMYGIGTTNKVAPTTPDGQTPYVQASLEALRTMTVEELKLMSEVGRRRDAILARRNAGSH
jgi:N-acetylmuramic acid 6-phosphate (MurNAc-6-P) etherase